MTCHDPSFLQGDITGAWETILPALKRTLPERSFANNFYIQECSLPLEGALTLVSRFTQGEQPTPKSASAELPPNFMLGWSLLRTAQRLCTSEAFDLFVIETSGTVEAAEAAFRRIAKATAGGIAQLEVGTEARFQISSGTKAPCSTTAPHP